MATIEQTAEMVALLEKQNKLYAAQGQMIKGQMAMMQQLQTMMGAMSFEKNTQELGDFQDVLSEAVDEIESYAGTTQSSMDKMSKSLTGAEKLANKFGMSLDKLKGKAKGLAVIAVTLDGMKEGFDFSINSVMGLTNVLTTAAGAVMNLGVSILTLPFKILQGLINMSDQGGGGDLRQALEDIRKEFGSLKTGASEAIIDISRAMKGQLAETGLSTYRIFGNLAERLRTVTQYAQNMGNAFDLVRDSFVQNAERVGAYIKGLGLTEDGQAALAQTAIKSGKTLQEVGREVTTFAYQMGEAFGINGKQISRDVGDMMADVEKFGNLSVQTMTNVSVFARRLGVDFKDLLGVVDQFDNFEGAANSAAQLSQAFGLQLDTLSLINAQDPAERIEMLRQSFFAAGRSVENMTRQERALLATQTGLDQKTAAMVFSLENQNKSYADIQKSSEATKKKQLSQAEAMEKLADSIERLVKSGSSGSGGFFDRFIQGFSKGIRRSSEFREIMRHIHQSLMVVHRAGIQVGRAFVDAFPGVRDMLGAIGDFFDPARFRAKMSGVVAAFKDFFSGNMNMSGFLQRLKSNFTDFFDPNSAIAQKFLGGVKAFFAKMRDLFVEGIRIGFEGLRQGFDFIRELIANPEGAMKAASGSSNAMVAYFMNEIVTPLADVIMGPVGEKLWDSFKSMMLTIFSRVGDYLGEVYNEYKTEIITGLIVVFAGPAIVTGLVRGLVGTLGIAVAKGVGGAMKSGVLAARRLAGQASGAGSALAGATGGSGGGITAQQGASTARTISGLERVVTAVNNANITPATIVKMGVIAMVLGVLATGLAVSLGALIIAIRVAGITLSEIGKAVAFMGGATLITGALGALVLGLTTVGTVMMGGGAVPAIAGAAAVAVAGIAMVYGMGRLVDAVLAGPSIGEVERAAEFVGLGALIVGALGITVAALTTIGGISVLGGPLAFLGGVVLYNGVSGIAKLIQKATEELSGISLGAVKNVATSIGGAALIIGSLGLIGAELAAIGGGAIFAGMFAIIGGVALVGLMDGIPMLVQKAIRAFGSINTATVKATATKFASVATIFGAVADLGLTMSRIGLQAAADTLLNLMGGGGSSMLPMALLSLKGAVEQIVRVSNGINITDEDSQKMEAVAGALRILNSFAETLSMVSEATRPNVAEAVINSAAMTQNTLAVTTALSGMSAAISSFVGIVLGIVSSRTAEEMAKVEPVANLITALGGVIQSVTAAASAIPSTDASELQTGMLRMMSFMNVITTNMRTLFSGVITGLMTVVQSKSFDPEKLKAAAESFTSVFGALSSLMTSISDSSKGGGVGAKDPSAVLGPMMSSLSNLFSGGTFIAQMTSIITGMSGVGAALNQARMEAISQFSKGIGAISSALTTVSQELTSINSLAVQHVEKGVTALVMSINDIGDSIAAIKGVDLNAELRTLVDKLGLEGRDTLRINHGNYNLTVNLRVTVDTEEFEKALLRPTTTIHFDGR